MAEDEFWLACQQCNEVNTTIDDNDKLRFDMHWKADRSRLNIV